MCLWSQSLFFSFLHSPFHLLLWAQSLQSFDHHMQWIHIIDKSSHTTEYCNLIEACYPVHQDRKSIHKSKWGWLMRIDKPEWVRLQPLCWCHACTCKLLTCTTISLQVSLECSLSRYQVHNVYCHYGVSDSVTSYSCHTWEAKSNLAIGYKVRRVNLNVLGVEDLLFHVQVTDYVVHIYISHQFM